MAGTTNVLNRIVGMIGFVAAYGIRPLKVTIGDSMNAAPDGDALEAALIAAWNSQE